MEHSKWIDNIKQNPEELAEELSNLKYDESANFLELLANKIEKDSNKDAKRKRVNLALALIYASNNIRRSSTHIKDAWEICKPFMDNE